MDPKRKRVLKWLAWLGGAALVILAGMTAPKLVRDWLFYPSAPVANFPPPADATQARVQDLDYLEHYVRGYDRSYSTQARGEALDLIAHYRDEAAHMDASDFELAVARVVALARNGHSSVWSHSRARRHPALPVYGYAFDDGFYIVGAAPGYERLLGARLDTIGETPMADIIAAFRVYYGGRDEGYLEYTMTFLVQNTDFLHALGFLDDPTHAPLTVRLANGTEETIVADALPADPDRKTAWGADWLLPGVDTGAGRRMLDANAELPLYLQQGRLPFQMQPLPELNGLYVQFRQNYDADGHPIADFVREVRAAVQELKPQVLVVDERMNGGGDYTTTADLMFDLPGMLPAGARIYAIIGHGTFSAGISSVGFLKQAAGERLVLVGRRMGDSAMSWGETNDFVLPNSGIGITAARGLHDQIHGCYDRLTCYWEDFNWPTAVGPMDPDEAVPFLFEDYAAGRDAAMARIRELEKTRGA